MFPVILILAVGTPLGSVPLNQRRAAVSHYEQGLAAKKEAAYDVARQHLSKAIEFDPDWGAPYLELAVLLRTAASEAALRPKILQRARLLMPENPRVYFESALWELQRGDKQQALTHLRRALTIRRDYVQAHMMLAQTMEELGQYDQAQQEYAAVLLQKPLHGGALHGVAICARHLGRFEEEELALLRLVRLAPKNPVEYMRMARFYQRVGQSERAQEFISIANSLHQRELPRQMRPLPRSSR